MHMTVKKTLLIGNDDFRKLREQNAYENEGLVD